MASVAVVAAIRVGVYSFFFLEGSGAREDPPPVEAAVAQWLLHHTVPASFRATKNPLSPAANGPDAAAGQEVYRSKCELCHAYDGAGKTEIGSGEYPRPPDLRGAAAKRM